VIKQKEEEKERAHIEKEEPVKAYSIDMRERVLQAVDKGYPRMEIIKLFGVSRATIKR
jgi:transposase-like protein